MDKYRVVVELKSTTNIPYVRTLFTDHMCDHYAVNKMPGEMSEHKGLMSAIFNSWTDAITVIYKVVHTADLKAGIEQFY
jgi:hypothetical protein